MGQKNSTMIQIENRMATRLMIRYFLCRLSSESLHFDFLLIFFPQIYFFVLDLESDILTYPTTRGKSFIVRPVDRIFFNLKRIVHPLFSPFLFPTYENNSFGQKGTKYSLFSLKRLFEKENILKPNYTKNQVAEFVFYGKRSPL